jgi:soluble lytic murein transglycosylase-like protein
MAREKMDIDQPCPLSAKLRVADTASLDGLDSLKGCAADRIIVAPATASEFGTRAPTVIAPPAERPAAHSLSYAAVSDDAKETPPGDDAILSMRPASYATVHDGMIERAARRQRIDPLLLHAVIKTESAYRVNAVSSAGARGLMQLMPATARMLGVSSSMHPESNVDGGARLLRRLYGRYGDFQLTLAAYNAGEGAVARYGNKIPPFPETQAYVRTVLSTYERLLAEQNRGGR